MLKRFLSNTRQRRVALVGLFLLTVVASALPQAAASIAPTAAVCRAGPTPARSAPSAFAWQARDDADRTASRRETAGG